MKRMMAQKKKQMIDYQMFDPDYTNTKSSASTCVDDIQSITFGGINSRFWMLRKHFSSMSTLELEMAPFYCWNCLSLDLGHRNVDIVIKD